MVNIYNGIYSGIKRNKSESIELRWVNLEPVGFKIMGKID